MSQSPENNEGQKKQMQKMMLNKVTLALRALEDPNTRELAIHNKDRHVQSFFIYDLSVNLMQTTDLLQVPMHHVDVM